MKYDSKEDFGDDKKYYRQCSLINLENFLITGEEDDKIISEDEIPDNFILCDSGIADIIATLNKKGYKTLYSCEGHMDENVIGNQNGFSRLYVVFNIGKNPSRYFGNLMNIPRNFSIEISESIDNIEEQIIDVYEKDLICVSNLVIDIVANMYYCCDEITRENYEKYRQKDIETLRNWVYALPDLTVEESPAMYSEKIIDRETAQQVGFDFESAEEFIKDITVSLQNMKECAKILDNKLQGLYYSCNHIEDRLSNVKVINDFKTYEETTDEGDN